MIRNVRQRQSHGLKGNNIPEALKGVPTFDSMIEGVNNASGENEEFGDWTGGSVNFTDFTAQKNNATISDAIRQNVRLMNPMTFIGDRDNGCSALVHPSRSTRPRHGLPRTRQFRHQTSECGQGRELPLGLEPSA